MIELQNNFAKQSVDTYDKRRIKEVFNVLGFPVSRWKVNKLMKEANV
ncbi:MAG: hypothetical protein KAH18_00050 [Psychromonas sp.]|nr:hypothetical protein [Psychromonas sp.]